MTEKKIRSLILSIPRPLKRLIVITLDASLSCFAVWLSYYLRTGEFFPIWEKINEQYPLPACLLSILIFIPTFITFNMYRTVFRYSGSKVIISIIKAIGVYALFYITIFTVISIDGVPRTIGIIQPLIFFILVCISRLFALYFLGGIHFDQLQKTKKNKALIFGTGNEDLQLNIALVNNI